MDLISRRPFGEISTLRKEIDNLLRGFFSQAPLPEPFTSEWLPAVDVSESEDSIRLKAELPGLDAKDLDVRIQGDRLAIRGEKKKEEERKGEHFHCVERCYGSFERFFRLPATVQADKVEASFEKGILTIVLPKTEEAKTQEIQIKVK